MTERTEESMNSEPEAKFSIVTVPEHLRDQVIEYVRQLEADESDVSGFMLRTSSSLLGSAIRSSWCGTGCSSWDTKGLKDMGCGDSD